MTTPWITGAAIQAYIGADKISSGDAATLAVTATEMAFLTIERDLSLQTIAADYYDSNGTNYVLLNYWPIRSIGGVQWNGLAVQPWNPPAVSQGWTLDSFNSRKLVFTGYDRLIRGQRNIMITNLVAGYDLTQPVGSATGLPGAVNQALLLIASAVFNAQAADPNLVSENTPGAFSGTFHSGGVGSVPPGALRLLAREMRVSP